jgi:O-antigen/teichoic acid export membrane protein
VQVVLSGLQLFSDFGLRAAIVQSPRGDDPVFLNTGWVIQIGRGGLLFVGSWLLAAPAAQLYDAPMLAQLMPIAGLGAIIAGFNSTKVMTANRHLQLGRLTVLELSSQAAGIIAMIALAAMWQSVWALVVGGILGSAVKMALSHVMLAGPVNRFQWEGKAARNLFSFGKFIFISTMAGFLLNNADRAILGKYITLTELSVYTIAFFLASVPLLLHQNIVSNVFFPLYGRKPPLQGSGNRQQLSRLRFAVAGGLMALSFGMAWAGDLIIGVLYDARYALAGPILILLSVSRLPELMIGTYSHLALAAGKSGEFATWVVTSALVRTAVLFWGIINFGLTGGILAGAISTCIMYLPTVWLARRHGGWDPRHDLSFGLIALAGSAGILKFHADTLAPLWAVFQ